MAHRSYEYSFRIYPEGWVAEEGRDSTLEYRLSIVHAVKDDSGKFTCITPARYEHTINVVVKVGVRFTLSLRLQHIFFFFI